MLHACTARFDVTKNLENLLDFGVNKQGLAFDMISDHPSSALPKAQAALPNATLWIHG